MKQTPRLLAIFLIFTLLLSGCQPIASTVEPSSQQVDLSLTGALVNSISVLDLASGNQPPDLPATLINVTGKGRPTSATITGLSYAVPSEGAATCEQSAVAELHVVENPIVVSFNDGSLLHANSNPQGGTICLFADGSSSAQISLQISGGSGKYVGASGSLELAIKTHSVGRSLLAEEGRMVGEIILKPTTSEAQKPIINSKIVRYASGQTIDNIDPAIGENYSINNALISLYDALFIVRGDTLENNLVDRYAASPDASEFTFTLKENARFHDGSPVNADAVVYSWQRMLRLQGPPIYRWTGIADENSISKIDDFTVKLTLFHPFAPFLGTLAHFYIVNPEIVEANKGDDDGQTYLATHEAGSGPFTQGRWEADTLYEFKALPAYWNGWQNDNHIDGFEWIIETDVTAQLNALLAGDIQIADLVSEKEAATIRQTAGLHIEDNLPFAINSIKLNTQSKYLSDPNLRKAIAYALDYTEMAKRTNTPVTILSGPTPFNFPGAVKDLTVPTYDLEQAKAYLKQSQWPDGGITLDYAYVPQVFNEEMTGELLSEGLKQLNITLNMKPTEWDEMVASCTSPETGFDLINLYTIPAYLDPDANLYNQYHSSQWGSYNSCSFYKNETVDKLLDEARTTAAPDKRIALYNEANRQIAADQPAIWTFTEQQFVGASDCLNNFHSSAPDNVVVMFQDLTMTDCK